MPLPHPHPSELARTPETAGPDARRVLIVDDSRDSAEMLCEILQAYGCVARVAYDGQLALEIAPSFKPAIALIDISLPRMDGYELAQRLRQFPELQATKLIAVTGYSEASERRRSEEAGFDHHLVKPVDLNELRSLIGG